MSLFIDARTSEKTNEYATGSERTILSNETSLLVSVEQAARILGIGRTRTFELVMGHTITSVKI